MPSLQDLNMLGSFAGGIGLFLLGMKLMTDGLKMAAGGALRHILSRWTSTPLRGFLSGVLITSLVQASGAVTIAVIGFVNAGLLSLLQTAYVIYGTNIGTTMTSWLVAMVGFKIDVQALALPLIGLGMFVRLLSGDSRRGALGEALAGFGLFFLGIAILKDAFSDVGNDLSLAEYSAEGLGLLLFTGFGFVLTFLMQSSSAAMVVTITAAAGGVIPLTAAAATVIGANVGTTSTAALAVIGATPNAQRTAAVHVMFNLLTGVTALLLLGPLLALVDGIRTTLGLDFAIATELALFHTLFNILGVMMLWWFTPRLVSWLERRLRSAEEDLGRPVYLDKNVVKTPALALNALVLELGRMGDFADRMLRDAFSTERHTGKQMLKERAVMERLVNAVNDFILTLQRANLPGDISEHLPLALRVARYYMEVANVAVEMASAQEALPYIEDKVLEESMGEFRKACVALLELADPLSENFSAEASQQGLDALEQQYQQLKAQLLHAGSRERIRMQQMVAELDIYSTVRRAMEQAVKGASRLRALMELAKSYQGAEQDPSAEPPP
jgi:phosphate:Na+ symporter